MDKLHLILFLLHFSSISCFILPNKYFINCGSSANFTDSHRTFVGDKSTNSFHFSPKGSKVVRTSIPSSDTYHDLYREARTFRRRASYTLNIIENGTYMVRFHFFHPEGPTGVFSVSSFGSYLLQNFTVQNNSKTGVVKEFLVSIYVGKFVISFEPREESRAFVNAIEVFITPDGFLPDNATQVSPAGLVSNGDYTSLLSQVVHTVHRINVGGPNITPSNDTLWRQWVQDDPYLYTPDIATNGNTSYVSRPYYQKDVPCAATEYTAPDSVYQSAKINTNSTSESKITWGFHVSKNTKHLVRLHFCDNFSPSIGTIIFTLSLYGKFSIKINPSRFFDTLRTPFYFDHVVDSGDIEYMIVSICPRADSFHHAAYLNGLEIMQIMGPTCPAPNKASKRTVFVVVGPIIAGLALICTLVGVVLLVLKRNTKNQPFVATSVWSALPVVHKEGSSHVLNLNFSLRLSFVQLQAATENFNEELVIGKGGFGKVYSGQLSDGTKVAVKRSELWSGQGVTEFQTEINVLCRIRHRHLVPLIGYCDEGPEMILVYEFMEKGTLRDHLYNSKYPCLSWRQRLDICIGAAQGLLYLHTGSPGKIIHRDIKSTNILLDENYLAKVADFGISKLVSLDKSHVTTAVKGTFGYYDPDYFRSRQLTEKSDVYSFGVVLLEVLCARPALDLSLPSNPVNLANWGLNFVKNGLLEYIVDPLIKDQINPSSLIKFWEIAERCLKENSRERPTMSDVLWHLEYALELQKAERRTNPVEDSATDCLPAISMLIQRFPSISLSSMGDDIVIAREDGAETEASKVFSQLKTDDA